MDSIWGMRAAHLWNVTHPNQITTESPRERQKKTINHKKNGRSIHTYNHKVKVRGKVECLFASWLFHLLVVHHLFVRQPHYLFEIIDAGSAAKEYTMEYFWGLKLAAVVNYPLWHVSALGQSDFRLALHSYPPLIANSRWLPIYMPLDCHIMAEWLPLWACNFLWKWLWQMANNTCFLGATHKISLQLPIAPPLITSTAVQCVNMPLVRAILFYCRILSLMCQT